MSQSELDRGREQCYDSVIRTENLANWMPLFNEQQIG